eukprot:TRINITY_DN20153_c0_g1_i6.p1 TRINITY_DN20153_c0_g1~~TRINITY_DN20153_c0_g1_i6.p1  ORF type:complete len:569 (+),score=110.72 TRINITY_DN20153_c0_g1_i6:225-1709(+)
MAYSYDEEGEEEAVEDDKTSRPGESRASTAVSTGSKDVKDIFSERELAEQAEQKQPLLATEENHFPIDGKTRLTLDMQCLQGAHLSEHMERVLALKKLEHHEHGAQRLALEFLEDPDSSHAAWWYNKLAVLFTMFAILLSLLPVYDNAIIHRWWWDSANMTADTLLLLETLARFLSAPRVSVFFTNVDNLTDMCCALPMLFRLFKMLFPALGHVASHIVCVSVPVIRLLRLVRRFPQIQLLKAAFQDCFQAMPVLLYVMSVLGMFFASIIYIVEPRDNITSMSIAVWLVLTTMTTVGFGDVIPITEQGLATVSVLMVLASLFMAMPVGIVGYSFTNIWAERDKILLVQGFKKRLTKWGFGAAEIPKLFSFLDLDNSASVDLQEFIVLMSILDIGFKEEEVEELFKTIDTNHSGTITDAEFVKTVFPEKFRALYAHRKAGGRVARIRPSMVASGKGPTQTPVQQAAQAPGSRELRSSEFWRYPPPGSPPGSTLGR